MIRVLIALLLLASPALAEPNCIPRERAVRELHTKYSETAVAMGISNSGAVVELFATENGSTWTVIVTLPSGLTCALSAGEDWETLPKQPIGEKT